MHELVIRGGSVVDGTGAPPRTADVGVDGGLITAVGRVDGGARRVVDADGLLVTPGWVDVHTHYDGQLFWDPLITPSSWNGVTTVVLGNCGVGFAPARPDQHEWLIELMTAIEDIPSETLRRGVPWGWETFGEYMDCLDRTPRAIDVGALVPHGAARAFVMGERSVEELASPTEIEQIVELIRDGMRAGALGCSTNHMTAKTAIVPGTFAGEDELVAVAGMVGSHGGILQTNPAGFIGDGPEGTALRELELMSRLSHAGRMRVTFPVVQYDESPEFWRRILAWCEELNAAGAMLTPQVLGRPMNSLLSLISRNPFRDTPTFQKHAALPRPELAARLADPTVRSQIMSEVVEVDRARPAYHRFDMEAIFPMADPPDYEPTVDDSIAAIARRAGVDPVELLYDRLLDDGGNATFLWVKMNYAYRNGDVVREMIEHPATVLGLGDGGAHCLTLCDSTTPTTILTQWVRDRSRGPRLPIERAVNELSSRPAAAFGLTDRGMLAPGMKADINIIDLDDLRLGKVEFLEDLPGGAPRVVQRTTGYVATFVSGEQIYDHGSETGARPGRTIRRTAVRP